MERKCLICEKLLEEDPYSQRKFGNTVEIVYGATVWRSRGNFGSTKFDPMPKGIDEFLEAYVCDECLTQKGDLIYHIKARTIQQEEVQVQTYQKKVLDDTSRNTDNPDKQ